MGHFNNIAVLQQLVPDFNQELFEQSSIYRAQLLQLCRSQANCRELASKPVTIQLQAARANEESDSYVLGYN